MQTCLNRNAYRKYLALVMVKCMLSKKLLKCKTILSGFSHLGFQIALTVGGITSTVLLSVLNPYILKCVGR